MSDLALTLDELNLLLVDCEEELQDLKNQERAARLALSMVRRKLRAVVQETEYLRLLQGLQTGAYDRALVEVSVPPAPDTTTWWHRGKTVLGTLTLRRSKLLLARAKSLQLDRDSN